MLIGVPLMDGLRVAGWGGPTAAAAAAAAAAVVVVVVAPARPTARGPRSPFGLALVAAEAAAAAANAVAAAGAAAVVSEEEEEAAEGVEKEAGDGLRLTVQSQGSSKAFSPCE